jgi:hypothetical protein
MNFAFHPDAEDEFNSAIDYYENIEFGLGYDFTVDPVFYYLGQA